MHVHLGAVPKFLKPHLPYATKSAIGAELDQLEAEGIVEKVAHSAAHIVAVPKRDGTYRICGDHKITVNPALNVDRYPLPKLDELFSSLRARKFPNFTFCMPTHSCYSRMNPRSTPR